MESNTKKMMWNMAGTAGLLLGLISTASMFIGQFISTLQLSVGATSFIGLILWAAETGGCIYFMYFFMKKYAAKYPDTDSSATFKLGMATAFLSALVYSAASFANLAFISADFYTAQYQTLIQQISPMLDSNSKELLKKMIATMPQLTFFSNLIYCTIFGTVVSSVLSRSIPSKDPFKDYRPDEQ